MPVLQLPELPTSTDGVAVEKYIQELGVVVVWIILRLYAPYKCEMVASWNGYAHRFFSFHFELLLYFVWMLV